MAAHPAVKLLKTSLRVFLEKFHATKTTKNSQSLHLKLDRFFLHENHKLSKKIFIYSNAWVCLPPKHFWQLQRWQQPAPHHPHGCLVIPGTPKVPPEKSNRSVLIKGFWRPTSIGICPSHTLHTNSESRKLFSPLHMRGCRLKNSRFKTQTENSAG